MPKKFEFLENKESVEACPPLGNYSQVNQISNVSANAQNLLHKSEARIWGEYVTP